MGTLIKRMLVIAGVLMLISLPAYAQYTTFIVDSSGAPLTYPTLSAAIATAQTYAGGPHKIMIKKGTYADADLSYNPLKIGEIYGDPAGATGDVIFKSPAGTHNFITAANGLIIKHMKLMGYKGTGVYVTGNGVTVEDIIIRGASGNGVVLSGCDGAVVDGLSFSKLDNGVYANAVTNATIKNSVFDSCGYAAQLYNVTTNGLLDKLTITNGDYGIYLDGGSTGAIVQNCSVTGTKFQGIYLNAVGGTIVQDNTLFKCGQYGIYVLNSAYLNLIKNNCLSQNLGGASQGFDNNAVDSWTGNYFSNYVFLQDGGAGVTDLNPKKYEGNALAAASSYNINDIVNVDFSWVAPVCANVDSAKMAAYTITFNYDQTKLQYVAGSAAYDYGYLGPSNPALYTDIDAGTPGKLTFAAANFTTPGVNGGRLAYAQFKVIAGNTTDAISLDPASDFRDPGNVSIGHGNTPLVLTLVDNIAPVLVSVVANNPAGDDTYSDGSVAGPGPFLKLFLTLHGTDNYALKQFYYRSDGGAWNVWMPASGINFTTASTQYDFVWLGLGEGTHTAGIRVEDMQGNFSNEIVYTYKIDRTAPAVPTVAVLDKDGCALDNSRWTNDPVVTVNLTTDGTAATMELSEAGDQPPIPFAASSTFTMTNAPGLHTVYAKLFDKYNNMQNWTASNAINLDMVAPVAVGPLVINGGALKTNHNTNDTLTLTDWGLGGYNFGQWNASETAANLKCGDAGWKPANPANYPHIISLSSGDGLKTVYFATRDSAGNISNVLSAQITLDQTANTFSSFAIHSLNAGFTCANSLSPAFMAVYNWTGTDAVELQYSWDNVTFAMWKNITGLPAPDSVTGGFAAGPDGWRVIYARLKDNVGNLSAVKKDSIYVITTPVTMAGFSALDKATTYTPDPTFAGVTNASPFVIKATGLSADVTKIKVSQDGGTTWTTFNVAPAGGIATFDYTWSGTPATCAWLPLKVEAFNCAGTSSGVITNVNGVYFDIAGPTITSFTGPAISNTVNVSLSIVASDVCGLYQMRMKEGALTGTPWVPFNASPTFTLATGDGNHTINLEVSDYGGNVATKSVTIMLDQTVPTAGTFVIKSANLLAAPGYTDNLAGNTATITWPGDVVKMWIQNSDGSNPTGWINPVSPYALSALVAGGVGIRTVNYWFLDAANNQGGPFPATINYDNTLPPPPATATGIPGGSTKLAWSAVTSGQKYHIRFNFQNQYPTYPDPLPPNPATMGEGIFAAEVAGTTYDFAGPQPDIYAFSIWTLGKNGLYSATPNIQVIATNYILGDFYTSPDGCIKFGDEFGALAVAYNSIFGDPNFNMYLDIAPTNGALPTGYPMPDQKIDFEDLVIFALNYDDYHCSGAATQTPAGNAPKAAEVALDVTAVVPTHVTAGTECVVPIKITDYEAVKGYHVVLDYDHSNFDVVRVEKGSGYESVAESFFYVNPKTSKIDVSGVVLGKNVTFTGDEIFRVVLKARSTSDAEVQNVELTFRDRENQNIAASLTLSRTVTLPTEFSLSQNYPNPFNPTTTIEFSLPTASNYKLTIYNVLGQTVKTFEGQSDAGYLKINWDASMQSSGIYLYRMEAGSFEATRKMVLLK